MIEWNELSRPEQKALMCLFGGGSLNSCDPNVILRLRQLDLIDSNERRKWLNSLGWAFMDFTHAELKARMGMDKPADERGHGEDERDSATGRSLPA